MDVIENILFLAGWVNTQHLHHQLLDHPKIYCEIHFFQLGQIEFGKICDSLEVRNRVNKWGRVLTFCAKQLRTPQKINKLWELLK